MRSTGIGMGGRLLLACAVLLLPVHASTAAAQDCCADCDDADRDRDTGCCPARFCRRARPPARVDVRSRELAALRALAAEQMRDPSRLVLFLETQLRVASLLVEMDRPDEAAQALDEAVAAYGASISQPGSPAAELAAEARFRRAELTRRRLGAIIVKVERELATVAELAAELVDSIQRAEQTTQELVAAYAPVLSYGAVRWTVAALVEQGAAYERLAQAIRDAQFTVPAALRHRPVTALRPLPALPAASFVQSIRQTLGRQTEPIECRALAHYLLAARAATSMSSTTEHSQRAMQRLLAHGDARLFECAEVVREIDPAASAYQLGELQRLGEAHCDAGDTEACAELGAMLFTARGVFADRQLGRTLLGRACDRGHAQACQQLQTLDPPRAEPSTE